MIKILAFVIITCKSQEKEKNIDLPPHLSPLWLSWLT